MFAVAAAGYDLGSVKDPATGLTPVDWMRADTPSMRSLPDWGLRLAALLAAGADPRDFGGEDHVARVLSYYHDGAWNAQGRPPDVAWALLALLASGVEPASPPVKDGAAWLLAQERVDGGWGPNGNDASSLDTTGMVLVALARAEADLSTAAPRAKVYFKSLQNRDGGFSPYAGAGFSSVQSTAWAIHGIRAIGESPSDWTSIEGESPVSFLEKKQRPDGGWPAASVPPHTSLPWPTAEALQALSGIPHPVGRVVPLTAEPERPRLGDIVRFRLPVELASALWEFGDGASSTLPTPAHVFAASGALTVTVIGRGADGHVYRGNLRVDVQTIPPVARLHLPSAVTHRGVDFTIDASASADADGRVVAYLVDWGDGNATRETTPRPSYRYERLGAFNLTLRVVDDAGATSEPAGARVRVENRAPRLYAPVEARGDRLNPIVIPSGAIDPDGDPVDVTWHVGDALVGTGDALVRRFSTLGPIDLRLRAVDAHNASVERPVRVLVENLPPRLTLAAEPRVTAPGEPVRFTARAIDPEGRDVSVRWLFENASAAEGPDVARAFTTVGAQRATAVATDEEGGETRETITIAVFAPNSAAEEAEDAPPVILDLALALAGPPAAPRVEARVEAADDRGHPEVEIAWEVAGEVHRARREAPPYVFDLGPPPENGLRARATAVDAAGQRAVGSWVAYLRAPPAAHDCRVVVEPPSARAGERVIARVLGGTGPYGVRFGDGEAARAEPDAALPHAYAAPGEYTVGAVDARSRACASARVTIENRPPLLNVLTSASASPRAPADLVVAAYDPDDRGVELTATLAGAPLEVRRDAAGLFTVKVPSETSGPGEVVLRAEDADGGVAVGRFAIATRLPPTPPGVVAPAIGSPELAVAWGGEAESPAHASREAPFPAGAFTALAGALAASLASGRSRGGGRARSR